MPQPSRRFVLAGLGGLAAHPAGAQEKKSTVSSLFAYVGCRTTRERNARGDGITVYRVTETGWTQVQLVENLLNPSYLAFDREKRFLYSVHGDSSEVSAFRVQPDGRLSFLNKQSCQGKNPVHLTVDPANRFLLVANHLTVESYVSNIAVLPRRADGGLEAVGDLMALAGKTGPHRVEQPFAKPHQVEYDPHGRFIAVPDKGCDLVRMLALNGQGKLTAVDAPAAARPGAGPRHIAFTPDARYAYVVNELDSTVTAFRYAPETGALTPFQRLSSTPDSFTGYSTAAEIAVAGRAVYVSNRGHDSIGAFAIDPADGRLTPLDWAPSGGRTPRFFAFAPDERKMFAANEDGDSITAFDIEPSGLPVPRGVVVHTGSPTCIVFSNA
jgi:6-phosphogluconolactonase (cycloisomerase 2 family)